MSSSSPCQICTTCGAVEIVRPDDYGFPPDTAKRRLSKRCAAVGHVSTPVYHAGFVFTDLPTTDTTPEGD